MSVIPVPFVVKSIIAPLPILALAAHEPSSKSTSICKTIGDAPFISDGF